MKTVLRALAVLAMGIGLGVYAQQPGPGRTPQRGAPQQGAQAPPDTAQPDAQKTTVTGCLAKGSQSNQYTITDKTSREKYTFPGPAQLDAYVNQTVKLTGSMQSGSNGEKVFRPESIAPVSSSCS